MSLNVPRSRRRFVVPAWLAGAVLPSGRRPLWQTLAAGVAFLTVGGALLHHDHGRRVALAERLARASANAEVAVPLGTVRVGEPKLLEVSLDNPGRSPLRVLAAVPTCDCLKVLAAPRELAAGRQETLSLAFEAEKVGAVDVVLTVRFAGEPAPPRSFRFTGLVTAAHAGKPPEHLVTATSLLQGTGSVAAEGAAPVYVDVRAVAKFQRAHVPGAVNVPLFAVKTRTHLKARPVVLVAEGYDDGALGDECRRLHELGWEKAAILRDGMSAWAAAGGKLEGDRPADPGLDAIAPADFARVRQVGGPWVVVAPAAAKQDADFARAFAGQAVVYADGNEEANLRQVHALLGTSPAAPEDAAGARLLLVGDSARGGGPPSLDARKLPAGVPVFHLVGGTGALRQELAFNNSTAAPASRSVTLTGSANGHVSPGMGSSTGCSTCPKR